MAAKILKSLYQCEFTALYYEVYVPKHIPEVVRPMCTRKCVILVMFLGGELSFVLTTITSFIRFVITYVKIGLRNLIN